MECLDLITKNRTANDSSTANEAPTTIPAIPPTFNPEISSISSSETQINLTYY